MISVTQLRNGATFLIGKEPFRVLKYTHTHLSRGGGTIRVKARSLLTGHVCDKTFKSGERVEDVEVERKKLQFLYRDGDEFYFMHPVTFAQIAVLGKVFGGAARFLTEGKEYVLFFWDSPTTGEEEVLDIDLPAKMDLPVIEAAPGVKGDTQASVYKDAVLANGLKTRVPLFIRKGDVIRVDTRTGEYVERAN